MQLKAIICFSILSLLYQSPVLRADDGEWEDLGTSDGITSARKEVPGAESFGLRGEAVIEFPPAQVASVLVDYTRMHEWMDRLIEAKNVKELPSGEHLGLYAFQLPWPVLNREFLVQTKVTLDAKARTMRVDMKSVVDAEIPDHPDMVRGFTTYMNYEVRPEDGGKKTFVKVEALTDLQGALPHWLVNLIQKSWPHDTVMGMREQLAKPDFVTAPEMTAFFSGNPLPN